MKDRDGSEVNSIDLKELESRCIQEEPAYCTARCPIHVDVRAFLKAAASGAWDEAFRVLALNMPLPGIVGRVCDHPCQLACKRNEAGGAIEIGRIERTAATRGRIAKRRTPLPAKKWRVAVIGNSLSSLAAAWELAYKGYRVTIFQAAGVRVDAVLWGFTEDCLPRGVIEEEMAVIGTLGVEMTPVPVPIENRQGWIESILGDFDAVYMGLDRGSLFDPDAGDLPEDFYPADPQTLATRKEALFSGGRTGKEASFSAIGSIATGRRAALSIDRFLQKVSLSAGREKEGPYETRLFTSLEHVTPEPPKTTRDPSGYGEAEAIEEAKRCLQCECMECVKVCRYLERFESYPKRYVRQVAADATVLMGSHGATSRLVNSCSLCDLCAVVCPHDLSMADVSMEGRRSLVERDKMPPSAHWFALEDMLFSNSEKAALAFHEPGRERSRFVFFPGCQMAAIYPEHVSSTYDFLRRNLEDVGLMVRCCGVPAKWAARDDLFDEALHGLEEAWKDLGSPTIIVACPTCYQTIKEGLPQAEVTTLWEVMADIPTDSAGRHTPTLKLALHDPCSARHEPQLRDAVRKILGKIGCDIEELILGREETECCGFGGLQAAANPSLAKDVAQTRAARSALDYVTYCATCRNVLAGSGKRVLYLLDLFFGEETDPAGSGVPGLSELRENRYRLKQKLLKGLWKERAAQVEDYEKIRLRISPKVRGLMEERRILTEDVQKVIDHAEKTGTRFFNPDTGHWRASFKPAHVTYWVEYSPEGKGFRVHNAYCHRMEIMDKPQEKQGGTP
jgi:NADPH-dependent glutamate synthase beta subunit-like oxidoreductase